MDKVVIDANKQGDKNLEDEKKSAKDELDKKGEDAKKEVIENPNLTDKEKEDLVKEIEDAVNKGKEGIDNSTNIKEVEDNQKNTNDKIDDIVDKANVNGEKNKAKDKLEDEAKNAIDEINKLPNLTEKEKEAYINQINKILEDALKAIDNGNTIDDINSTVNKAVVDMKNVVDAAINKNATNGGEDLPSTGISTNNIYLISGGVLVLIGLLAILRKKRR